MGQWGERKAVAFVYFGEGVSGSRGDKGRFRPQTNKSEGVTVCMLKLLWRKDGVDWKRSAETVQSTLPPKTRPD